jgi:hypothetical protein
MNNFKFFLFFILLLLIPTYSFADNYEFINQKIRVYESCDAKVHARLIGLTDIELNELNSKPSSMITVENNDRDGRICVHVEALKRTKRDGSVSYKINGWFKGEIKGTEDKLTDIVKITTGHSSKNYSFIDKNILIHRNCEDQYPIKLELPEDKFQELKTKRLQIKSNDKFSQSNGREYIYVNIHMPSYAINGWIKGKINGTRDWLTDIVKYSEINNANNLSKGASWVIHKGSPFIFKDNDVLNSKCEKRTHFKRTSEALNDSLVFTIKYDQTEKCSDPFKIYEPTKDLLFRSLLGKRALSSKYFLDKKDLLLSGKRASSGLIEVKLPDYIKLLHLDKDSKVVNFKVRILVIGSSHALSLSSISLWDGDWGKQDVDKFLQKQIEWINIDRNLKLNKESPVPNFKTFAAKAKTDASIVSKLDGSAYFQSLATFLDKANLGKVDYVIILKDNWDALSTGIEALIKQLKNLNSIYVDILSTSTPTDGKALFEALANSVNGRYYESTKSIQIHGGVGNRINGKIRSHYRQKLKEMGISRIGLDSKERSIFVKEDESNIRNLITLNNARIMLGLIELLKNPETSEDKLKEYLNKYNLEYEQNVPLHKLFQKWFMGFNVPPSSPIYKKNLIDIVLDIMKDKEGKIAKLLDKIEASLTKIDTQAEKENRKECTICNIQIDVFR